MTLSILDLALVPAGVEHNVIDTSSGEPLRPYTFCRPTRTPDGTVHRTKADESAEH